MPRILTSTALTLALASGLHGARMPEPISYTLRFPAPQTHYAEIEALVPTDGLPEIELTMAVWTPGSYLVREFSRNVESVSASTLSNGDKPGEPLTVEKTAKNHWRIATRKASRIAVRYRVYSREMSVRTNWIDADFALLNGAATFLTRAGAEKRPYEIRLVLPEAWTVAISPLTAVSSGEHAFRAEDFDTLVDSPLYAGNGRTYAFEAGGKPHVLLNEGEGTVWDGPRSAADAGKIAQAQIAFWGEAPYPRYVFFNLLTEAGGGLEHKNACTLMSNRWRTRTREGYLEWLGLVSHELFHAWNGKRLRPAELGPFDYEREVYTRNLWVVEGITSYYGDLLLHRAGLSTRKQYLKNLSKAIETLQTTPGRLVQPMDEASFDAWIKLYRRDENTPNTTISYYTKGEVVAFLLDARIRRATGGQKSLDDALRLAYRRFSGERGYTAEEFRQVLEEVAGTIFSEKEDWLARTVESTAELDYQEALDWYGLRFASGEPEKKEAGEPQELPAGWLGMDVEVREGRLVVTQVKRGTPAYEAGVNVDDEILAIDDYRVPPNGIENRLKAYRPGEKATLLVARRERLTRLPVTFGEKPKDRWKLEARPDATEEQKAHLAAWLADAGAPVEKEEAPVAAAVP